MEHRPQSKNAYKKVSTENTASSARSDALAPLALSRPNEKYGATALSVETQSPSFSGTSRKPKISIEIIYLCVLIGDMTRGILFPTMWLFVLSMGGSKILQGIAIASFSTGRVLFSPILGRLSDVHGHRRVLVVSNIIISVGAFIYSAAPSFFFLALGQFIMGSGSASLGVTRSYVAEYSVKKDRTVSLAILTAVQYFGFTVTPVFGAILAAIGAKHRTVVPIIDLSINEYSMPAIFMGCLAASNAAMLHGLFEDRPSYPPDPTSDRDSGAGTGVRASDAVGMDPETATERQENETSASSSWLSLALNMTVATKVAIGGCVLNMAMKGTIGVFETLGSEFVTKRFHWDSLRTGYTFATFGALGVLCLLSFGMLQRLGISDISLIIFGSISMTCSCLLLSVDAQRISVGQFCFAVGVMYILGYPLGNTALLGAISKGCGDKPQGNVMGWFAASGSLARIVFPLLAGSTAQAWGDGTVFGISGIMLLLTSFFIVFYRGIIASIIE